MNGASINHISKYGIIFRNRIIFSALMILTVGVLVSCSSDNETETPEDTGIPETPEAPVENLAAESMLDVSYGADTDQAYDIYLPANRSEATKILVLVHGGGWTSGDKADMDGFKDFLRQQLPDIAVVNMNYRLADDDNSPYPMQTDDIGSVIENLKNKTGEFQIGTELGFVGVSAGGHLSLLWSYAFDTDQNVKMVCSVVGPTNLVDEAYQNSEDEILKDLVNQFDLDDDILTEASPLFQATETSPPTILFYGGKDPLVPVSQGIDLEARLIELGVAHEFTLYEEEGHGWVGINLFDTSVKLQAFIEKHL